MNLGYTNLDILERYLQAVKPLLPRKAQDDILRELSENIRCRMEEREADLGRPLTTAEQEEIIKEHGHPVVVAARYGQTKYLIGPAVFPLYWLILRIAAVGAPCRRGRYGASQPRPCARDSARAALGAFRSDTGVFWVTAAFAAFELCSSLFTWKWKNSWSPSSLPVVGTHSPAVSRTESVAQILFGAAFIVWWQAIPHAPFLLLGPAASIIAPAPIWTDLHRPILLLVAAGVAQACVDLARPQQTKWRAKIRLAIHAAGPDHTLPRAARGRLGDDGSRRPGSGPLQRRDRSLKSDLVLLPARRPDYRGCPVHLAMSAAVPGSCRYSCRSACQGLMPAARRAGK